MNISPIAKKLGIKPAMHALVLGAPAGYQKLLSPLPEGARVSTEMKAENSFLQAFITRQDDIKRTILPLLDRAISGALVWITYPKKTSGVESDLNRDIICEALKGTGWRAVSIVAIDEVWAALRIRPEKDVRR